MSQHVCDEQKQTQGSDQIIVAIIRVSRELAEGSRGIQRNNVHGTVKNKSTTELQTIQKKQRG